MSRSSSVLVEPRRGCQRPRRHRLPRRRVGSAGPDACEFGRSLGYELDDWQEWCIDGILSEDANFRLVATVACILVSRQNGKNVILEVVELYVFFVLGWPIVHTAHRADTSAEHMLRLTNVIDANPDLAAQVTVTVANGKERITRRDTKVSIQFYTRSKKIGRSKSPRMVVLDEALYVTAEHMQALLPAMSAQSMREDAPLLVWTSSAPVPESHELHRVIAAFVDQDMDGFFADWGAPADCNPADREVWYQSNPGLGVRISEEWIAEQEFKLLDRDAFMIERLGVIFAPDATPSELPDWALCADPDSSRSGGVSLAVAVAPDLSWSSIGVAADRDDARRHVELVKCLPGTTGVVEALAAIAAKHDVPVRLRPRSEAGGLIAPLGKAGVRVIEVGQLDYLKACVGLRQATVPPAEGVPPRLVHIDQDALNVAVLGAVVKASGDGWEWSARSSKVDISPLEAITLAFAGDDAVAVDPLSQIF